MKIRLIDIEKSFASKQVIRPVSITIESGSFTTLLVPSDCGKTTLLRMIAGLEKPDEGEIWFDNTCVFSGKDGINFPPEKSGACKDFLAGLVTGLEDGEAIIQAWADNGLTVPGANKAALEAVTTCEKGILIAGVDYNAYSSIDDGEPLAIYYPESGTVVNPRPAMIMNTAPNVENAQAFIDFLFSDEAQQLVAEAYLIPGRSDVPCEGRTTLDEIPQLPTDWEVMMEVAADTAANLNEICQ